MRRNDRSSTSIGFCGLLTIVFITLKLTNFITWSWWWIISPLWIPIVIVLTVLVMVIIVSTFIGIFAKW